jgi:thiol-disulfide isomerase/thioredoxin
MNLKRHHHVAGLLATCGVYGVLSAAGWAAAPSADQALGLTPIQQNVDYTRPNKDQVPKCTIRAEKEGSSTAWIVRDPQGEMLRRFADTNADNIVDTWCYYRDGIEVYRDVDSNFNGKADQYRWFHTAGTRWGTDQNEDGRIDMWRVISAAEVAEELVEALRTRDPDRYVLLLLTPRELGELGLGRQQADAMTDTVKTAEANFRKLVNQQKVVLPKTQYIDFDSARPGTIPAGTGGSTKDVTICESSSALVTTDGKNEQVFLGALVAVGDTWKLVDLPVLGSEGQPLASGFMLAASASVKADSAAGDAAPTDEMQRLMAELDKLDRQAAGLTPEKQASLLDQRADLLRRLAEATTDVELREQWYRQLADEISAAVQSAGYAKGLEQLEELQKTLSEADASKDLIAHVEFQRMWANYALSQQQPNADAAKIQEKWLADLEDFTGRYPDSPDSAEALLQLGMYREFIGKTDDAIGWYTKLATSFADNPQASKAQGAIRRLGSVGKPIRLRSVDLQGRAVDLASYRGKVVLIQYWATWCEPCVEDMARIKDLYAKYANRGFEVIGVVLDNSPAPVKQFLTENRYPWRQIQEPGGLDSRLANEMGVMTPPLMILVDQKGNVVSHSIHVDELDAELAKLLK